MASLGPPRFSSTTPHFFKIILEDTSRHKLKIPKKFVMKYGKDLSNSACLKLPSGSEWKVELIRCKGKVWFEQGWSDFSMFCSLEYGSFLLFRYEGNSHFNVCIFDKSATEIDYPITMPNIVEANEDDDLYKEDLQPSLKTRRKSPLPCSPSKKMRTSLSGKADMIFESESLPMESEDSHCNVLEMENQEIKKEFSTGEDSFPTKKDGGSSSSFQSFLNQTPHEPLERMNQLTATEKANAFKSDQPSFRMAMQPSSIHYNILGFPNEFAKRYLMKLPAGFAILRISDGRTWSVKFKYDHANSRARLLKGWAPFVRDNNLKVGDVCDFTLVDCIELLFDVSISPRQESANFPLSTGHGRGAIVQVEKATSPTVKIEHQHIMDGGIGPSSEIGKIVFPNERDGGSSSVILKRRHVVLPRIKPLTATGKYNAITSDKPSFRITMHPYSIHYNTVSLPSEFSKRYLRELSSGIVIFQVLDGRTWSVRFKYDHANSRAKLMKGWSPFVRDNNLKVDDVCLFTLINCTELVFDVVFFPSEESANCPLLTGHGSGPTVQVQEMKSPLVKVEPQCSMSCEIGKNRMLITSDQVTRRPSSSLRTIRVNLEAASKFSSKNPFFKVTVGTSHSVHVPGNFARSFIKKDKQRVMLQVKDRSWPVIVISYKQRGASSIGHGWAAFAKENFLGVGDVCIFELIEKNGIVLKVHIFRC